VATLLPAATVEQTCRIGRYTVVAIEQVVDPHLHHLNAAVALGESIASEERGPGRNGKCPIAQPKIIILDLRRPIGQEGPLDARTYQPAAVGVVVGGGDRCTSRRIGDGEVVAADPTATGLAIKEPVAIGHAEPGSQGRDPTIVGSLDSSDRRKKYGTGIVIIRNPIEVPFKSQNKVADLPVEPELASSNECAVVISVAEVEAQEGVGHVIVPPGSPNVAAKIEPGPTEERRRYIDRRRIDRRRGCIRRHISGIRGHQRCQQHRQRCGRLE